MVCPKLHGCGHLYAKKSSDKECLTVSFVGQSAKFITVLIRGLTTVLRLLTLPLTASVAGLQERRAGSLMLRRKALASETVV